MQTTYIQGPRNDVAATFDTSNDYKIASLLCLEVRALTDISPRRRGSVDK